MDRLINILRLKAPAGHSIHTADNADLRIAVTYLCDQIAADMEYGELYED